MDVKAILKAKGPGVVTIQPHVPIATAVHLLTDEGIGALVVSDNGKRVLGMISIGDVIKNRLAEAEMEAEVLRDAYLARSSLPG